MKHSAMLSAAALSAALTLAAAPAAQGQDTTTVQRDTMQMQMDTMQMQMGDTMQMQMGDTMQMQMGTDTMQMRMQMQQQQMVAPPPAAGTMGMGAGQTIAEVAMGNPEFETLTRAVQAAGLAETLGQPGPYTVFAPTDAAFDQLPPGALDRLLENPDQLRNVLSYHVVSGELTAEALQGRDYVETLNGERLPVRVQGGSVYVGNALVTNPGVEASNGVVHVINGVLMPPERMEKM